MSTTTEGPQPQPESVSTVDRIHQSLLWAVVKLLPIVRQVPIIAWIGMAIAIVAISLFNGFSFLLTAGMWILIVAFGSLAIAYAAGVCNDVKTMGLMGTNGKLPFSCAALIATLLFIFLPNKPKNLVDEGSTVKRIIAADVEGNSIKRFITTDVAAKNKVPRVTSQTFEDSDLHGFMEGVKAYRAMLDSFDASDCPADFQKAFLEHKFVWHELDDYVDDLEVLSDRGLFGTFQMMFIDLFGDMFDFSKRLESTWRDVERIAAGHGVQAPQVNIWPLFSLRSK